MVNYDSIAEVYDSLFSDEKSFSENIQVVKKINYSGGSVLEIGCGTGLMPDLIDFQDYLGIDPSKKMLEVFSRKHDFEVVQSCFESFETEKRFDLILSTFGSISYVEPRSLEKIRKLLNNDGRFFLMFYKPDYFPKTYSLTGEVFDHYNEIGIDGEKSEFGNYIIVEGKK